MPARVVVVHDDPDFLEPAVAALKAVGIDAVAFGDSMLALDALDAPQRIEVLVTCLECGAGKPNGIALARMARSKRSWIKVIFIGNAEMEQHTAGLGELLEIHTNPSVMADAVSKMLLPSV